MKNSSFLFQFPCLPQREKRLPSLEDLAQPKVSWASSGSWWWTGTPAYYKEGLQGVGHDWATELDWFEFQSLEHTNCEISLSSKKLHVFYKVYFWKKLITNWRMNCSQQPTKIYIWPLASLSLLFYQNM